jgi:hypothetical protein
MQSESILLPPLFSFVDDKNKNYYLFLVVHLVAEIFRRSEVGIRLGSGALLLLLDLDLVVALPCLVWFR